MQGIFKVKMELLRQVAFAFGNLKEIKYRVVLSAGREKPRQEIIIDFCDEDLFHILGLQHLTDIELPKNKKALLHNINNGTITEGYLENSEYYNKGNEDYNIKQRIEMACCLEDFLDSEHFTVSVYKCQHENWTNIEADYLITCKKTSQDEEYYIFVRQRKETETFGIVSCFPKGNKPYWGGKRYLLLKEKILSNTSIVLFKHKNYFEQFK